MPARPFDPRRDSFYLDSSTFSYAFNAVTIGGRGSLTGMAGLMPVVEQIASCANLIFSHIHLGELAAWQDADAARGVIKWLDGLPLVWARFWPSVQIDEDEYWVKTLAGCSRATVCPFAPSMVSTFESISVQGAAEILATAPTLLAAFEMERNTRALAARMKQQGLEWAEHFHDDRAQFADAAPAEICRLKERSAWRLRSSLRRRAMETHERLTLYDAAYARSGATLNTIIDPFVALFLHTPAALPISQVLERLTQGFIGRAAARTPQSASFLGLGSSMADIFHALIGAAYCSHFVCDRLTAEWLGDLREVLGLPQSVVFTGDGAKFVGQLRRALEVPAASLRRSVVP